MMRLWPWVFFSILFLADTAIAQRAKDWRSSAEQAARLSEEARAFYFRENFAAALDKYQELYKLSPEPVVLLEIALCQRQLRLIAEATSSYQRFAKENPTFGQIGAVQSMISCLIEEQQTKEPLSQPTSLPQSESSTSPSSQPLPGSQPATTPTSKLVCSNPSLDQGFEAETSTTQAIQRKAFPEGTHSLFSAFGPGQKNSAFGFGTALLDFRLSFKFIGQPTKRVALWGQTMGFSLPKIGTTTDKVTYLAGAAGAQIGFQRKHFGIAGRAGVVGSLATDSLSTVGGDVGLLLSARTHQIVMNVAGDLSYLRGDALIFSFSAGVEAPISRSMYLFGDAALSV